MFHFKRAAVICLCTILLAADVLPLTAEAATRSTKQSKVQQEQAGLDASEAANASDTSKNADAANAADTSKNAEAANASDTSKNADAANAADTSKNAKASKDQNAANDANAANDPNASNEQPDETTSENGEDEDTLQRATGEELIDAVMSTDPEDAGEPITEEPQYPPAPYVKEFNYSEDVVFSGIFETDQFYFRVRNYWDTQYAYARVQFTLSQLINDGPASLTFSVNNEPIYSCKVDYQDGREQIVYVPIPVDMLNAGYNSFGVTGYVRIYDEEGCIDDLTGANWVRLEKSSFVAVGYDIEDPQNLISWYPYPYLSTTDDSGSQTAVATSDAINEEELAAALLLRADLSAETDSEDNITLTTVSGAAASPKKVIVSLLSNLPAEYRSLLPADAGDLSDRAVIVSAGSGDDRTLLVTSADGDCLMEAAMLLVDDSRVTQEDHSVAYVEKDASQLMFDAISYTDSNAAYTLTSLAGDGLSYVGPFHQKQTIYLPFSGGYVLSGTGKIDLSFRYSENLDFDRSLITVYWGDTPVASKKLTKENAGGDTLSFSLPADVLGATANSIQIAFDLELPDLFCTPRMDEMPWAYVAETSTFYLPVGKTGTLSFDNQPAPFELSNRFNEVTVVIPDNITSAEMNTLGQVVALYGVNISAYGSIQVERASQFDGSSTDRNLIVLGTYQDNALLRTLNESLSFRYTESGTSFASNSSQILSEEFASRIGVMQLLQSPYGEDRALLAVCTANDDAMKLIDTYLRKDSDTWKLTDDAVVFDPNGEIRTYKFLDASSVQTPDLKQFIENNKDTVMFTVVAISAMLLLLLGVILILIRIYLARRKDK